MESNMWCTCACTNLRQWWLVLITEDWTFFFMQWLHVFLWRAARSHVYYWLVLIISMHGRTVLLMDTSTKCFREGCREASCWICCSYLPSFLCCHLFLCMHSWMLTSHMNWFNFVCGGCMYSFLWTELMHDGADLEPEDLGDNTDQEEIDGDPVEVWTGFCDLMYACVHKYK